MKAEDTHNPIPDQNVGSQIDAVAHHTLKTTDEAEAFFKLACKRLLNVNAWGEISGMSDFQLHDQNGIKVNREAQEGDYIQINIPGPGPQSGDGFDWVRIEDISQSEGETEALLSIRVRPSAKPDNDQTSPAHFLKETATSTFIVRKNALDVTAEEHGRNEVANTDTESIIDNGRNLLVGGAAKLGLSYPQWKLLVQGIVAAG